MAQFLSRYSRLYRSLKKIGQRRRREFSVSLKVMSASLVDILSSRPSRQNTPPAHVALHLTGVLSRDNSQVHSSRLDSELKTLAATVDLLRRSGRGGSSALGGSV